MRATGVLMLLFLALPSFVLQASPSSPYVSVPVRVNSGFGQVCPVSATEAWTARHVPRTENTLDSALEPIVFDSIDGSPGTAEEVFADVRRDVSFVRAVEGKFPPSFPRAERAPAIGEEVVLVGYDEYFRPSVVSAKVVSVFAGSITYDKSAGPGSSGSCVVSVGPTPVLYAINSAHSNRKDGMTGIGVAVYGAWGDVPERWRRVAEPRS